MSRTQQKLQAMSAQERLIQEKKRLIEEKLRLDNAKKYPNSVVPPPNSSQNSEQQPNTNYPIRNGGSFSDEFQRSQGQLPAGPSPTMMRPPMDQRKEPNFPPFPPPSQYGPPWFPPNAPPPLLPPLFDQRGPPLFPIAPRLPLNPPQLPPTSPFHNQSAFFPPPPLPPLPSMPMPTNLPGFIPPPFLPPSSFPMPPPELLSKMFQNPPPPLPVPPPPAPSVSATSSNPVNDDDLYDPLKVEDEEEEEPSKEVPSTASKPIRCAFNVKKEHTIKIEPNVSISINANQHEHQKHDIGGHRRHPVATTSTDVSSSSALWWKDDEDSDTDDRKPNVVNDTMATDQPSDANSRKRKSRWGNNSTGHNNIKQEPTEHKFVEQIYEATEKAKRFVAQLNEQMKLYPEGYDATKMMSEEQRGQYVEQKELQSIYQTMMVKRRELEKVARQQHKREYDSDEESDAESGTWEHRLRTAEMDITREWAVKLTDMAHGKHHIGDFIPAHELAKFMKTYSALKEGQTPDVSDYRDFKIQAENIGYRLLEKFGWKQGQGLGKNSQGIVDPINKGATPVNHSGLGQDRPSELDRNDDEFQMYRKRMMLAYRFRPNPLNNPRRDYY